MEDLGVGIVDAVFVVLPCNFGNLFLRCSVLLHVLQDSVFILLDKSSTSRPAFPNICGAIGAAPNSRTAHTTFEEVRNLNVRRQ